MPSPASTPVSSCNTAQISPSVTSRGKPALAFRCRASSSAWRRILARPGTPKASSSSRNRSWGRARGRRSKVSNTSKVTAGKGASRRSSASRLSRPVRADSGPPCHSRGTSRSSPPNRARPRRARSTPAPWSLPPPLPRKAKYFSRTFGSLPKASWRSVWDRSKPLTGPAPLRRRRTRCPGPR